MVMDGASPCRAWTPSANLKANPAEHKLRAANDAASSEWVSPGPGAYEIPGFFEPARVRGPPGFSRSAAPQRIEPRIKVHPLGRTLGPGAYDITGFGTFERYSPVRQQPWRCDRPTSRAAKSLVEGRPTSTRARDVPVDAPHRSTPGPAAYQMERYSGFVVNSYNNYGKSTRAATSSFGTARRSDITSTYGDRRAGIPCPAPATPSTAEYSRVPRLDRIMLSSSGAELGVSQLEPLARGNRPFLHSSESLRSTLSGIVAHSPDKPLRADLTERFKVRAF